MKYEGDNPVLRYFAIVRPQLWDAPDFERVAYVLSHVTRKGHDEGWTDITDALAELVPEQREFWLRVQATWNTQFTAAMVAMFDEPELTDDECTVIAAALAVKDGKERP